MDFDIAGSYFILPPEGLKGIFSMATDLFSLGCILFFLNKMDYLVWSRFMKEGGSIRDCKEIHQIGRPVEIKIQMNGQTQTQPKKDRFGNIVRETLKDRVNRMTFLRETVERLIHPDPSKRLTVNEAKSLSVALAASDRFKDKFVFSGNFKFVENTKV